MEFKKRRDNVKPNSMFFKSPVQYNVRILFNKLPEALEKEQNFKTC